MISGKYWMPWTMSHETPIASRWLIVNLLSRRHFLLSNGSLLIVNSGISDSGKYRCNATNQFTKKLYRPFLSMLSVVSRPGNNHNRGSDLLPQLQRTEQKIKSGQNLILHCASHTNKVRNLNRQINIASDFFSLLFSPFLFSENHRLCGHSRHVPATSQSASTASTMSWSTWMSRWQNMMEFIIAQAKGISR